MQDVPAYAKRAGLKFTCYYDATPAVLARDHCSRVNHEAFLFCSTEHRDAFEAQLLEDCGRLTDPVTKERFRPDADSATAQHRGVRYLFSSGASAAAFSQAPERFARLDWKMPANQGESVP